MTLPVMPLLSNQNIHEKDNFSFLIERENPPSSLQDAIQISQLNQIDNLSFNHLTKRFLP